MFSSVAKLKYLRLMYSPREPLRIAPGSVDTLLILDVVEFKACTRVYRDSTETSRVDDVGSKWAQWWETAKQDIANVALCRGDYRSCLKLRSIMSPDIRRSSLTLPNEILSAIVDEVDRLGETETLCSLLLVSHCFYAIAVRLIYKEMLLSLFHVKQIRTFAYLSRNIASNPGAHLITSFIFEYYYDSKPCFTTYEDGIQENMELILPYLVNVRRLHITFWPFAVFNSHALCLLPPGIQLTHLFVDRSIHLTDLSSFIALSHPFLESIVIRPAYRSVAPCQPFQPADATLSACALCPSLRRIEAAIEDLLLFEDAPPSLVSLGLLGQYPWRSVGVRLREHILRTFPSIHTLSFEGTHFDTGVAPVLPRLPQLKYLALDHSSMAWLAGDPRFSILSSVKLTYIRLTYPLGDPLEIAPIYFGLVDTLLILEIVDVKTYTRVHRDSMDAPHVYNIGVRDPKWVQWWEPAEEDISNVGRKIIARFFVHFMSSSIPDDLLTNPRSSPVRLPNEILIAIVKEVDNLDAPKTMCALLLVSRRFQDITIRRIYQELFISLFHLKQMPAFAFLSRNIASNPGVQFTTSFIFEYFTRLSSTSDSAQANIELILPYLVNVRRVHITFWPVGVFNPRALRLLPPSAQLSHLCVDRSIELTDLSPFLSLSHPSLETLIIRTANPRTVVCQPIKPTEARLSATVLFPSLRCLSAPIEDLVLFTDIPNSLVNLSVTGHGPYYPVGEEVEYVLQNFKGLRTLSVDETYFYVIVASLLRGLPDLEYLSLDGASMPPGANAKKLSLFSSTKLKYIRLTYTLEDPLAIATIFFSIVDTLLVFDVDDEMTYKRMYRDSIGDSQIKCGTVSESRWRQWWEQAVPEIEDLLAFRAKERRISLGIV
ncbi:hypothetical protein EYR40_002525 [Pleurotus pulmonarius]|nr:hypothetical protein EYR40_002525 [Pleurotus pulmonarius]